MAQIDFPSSTNIVIGDQYTAIGAGITYTWTGTRWTAMGSISIEDINGINLNDEENQDVLVYNGTEWQNQEDVNGGAF